LLAPWGPTKRHGAKKKANKKEAVSSTNDDFGRLSRFPENLFLLVSFFGKLIGFIAPEMVPWLSKISLRSIPTHGECDSKSILTNVACLPGITQTYRLVVGFRKPCISEAYYYPRRPVAG